MIQIQSCCHYMLLDTAGGGAKFITKAAIREIQLLARLYQHQSPDMLPFAPPVEGRSFSRLAEDQLADLVRSLGGTPVVEYSALLEQAYAMVRAAPVNPASVEALQARIKELAIPEPEAPPAQEKAPAKAKTERKEGDAPRGGTTRRVWELADALRASLGRMPTSKEVVAACEKEEIKAGTASVQYGKWKKVQ